MSQFEFKTAIVSTNDGTFVVNANSSKYSPIYDGFAKNVIVGIEDGLATINYNVIQHGLTFDEIPVTEDELGVKYRPEDVNKRKFTLFGLLTPYYVKGWYRKLRNGKEITNHKEVTTSNFKIIQ